MKKKKNKELKFNKKELETILEGLQESLASLYSGSDNWDFIYEQERKIKKVALKILSAHPDLFTEYSEVLLEY